MLRTTMNVRATATKIEEKGKVFDADYKKCGASPHTRKKQHAEVKETLE